MFERIDFSLLSTSKLFGYACDVPFFKERKALAFKPGLNILVGPNGSGKSTVLKMLADSMCATQGGVSTVTEDALSSGIDMLAPLRARLSRSGRSSCAMSDNLGVRVVHDGQPVVYCDPRKSVGLVGGAFDDDFFGQGLAEAVTGGRRSHGQQALARANPALAILTGKAAFPARIERRVSRAHVNATWQQALDLLEKRFEAGIARGQSTVLLDEPEANYSLVWQARLWELLAQPDVAERFQVIVASHSAFALGIPHAHYIDTVPGFREEAEAVLRLRFRPAF